MLVWHVGPLDGAIQPSLRTDLTPVTTQRALRVAVLTSHFGSRSRIGKTSRDRAYHAARPISLHPRGPGHQGSWRRFVAPEVIAMELATLREPAGIVAYRQSRRWFEHDRVRLALERLTFDFSKTRREHQHPERTRLGCGSQRSVDRKARRVGSSRFSAAGRSPGSSPDPQPGHFSRCSSAGHAYAGGSHPRRSGAIPFGRSFDRAVALWPAFRSAHCRGGRTLFVATGMGPDSPCPLSSPP